MSKPPRYAGKRQVTGFITEATYRKAVSAKLYSGKTLLELMEEGLSLAAAKNLPPESGQ